MKDFTPAQAAKWVHQEAPKHTTIESIVDRLASEKHMIGFMQFGNMQETNSYKAHQALVIILEARLSVLRG